MGKRRITFDIWWPERTGLWQFVKHHLLPQPGSVIFTLLALAVVLFAQSVGALPLKVPTTTSTSTGTISYQGRLADADGNPLTGTYNVEFRLYDVPTGGAPLWTEQWSGTSQVEVSDGLFNVMLGSIDTTLAESIEGHDELYLGITVEDDDEMTPRVQLGSVPWAMQANTVPDGSITTEKIASDAITMTHILDGAVTTGKIADGAITEDKLAPGLDLVPAGTIVMWSGSLSEIPDGWALCDGTDGTPDLRDRFILSVSAGENPGGTGGSHTKTLSTSNLPSHSHSISSDGDHRHSYTDKYTTGERTSGTHAWDATYDKDPVSVDPNRRGRGLGL